MCRQLGITRAAYYKWLARDIPETEKENETIAHLIREYDDRFNHILGYRRMTDWINRLNDTRYGRNRIHRIMKELNIHSVIRRKKKKYAYSTPEATAENTLSRDFNAERPNQKWATDVTEFKWYEGPVVHKLYLSAILDLPFTVSPFCRLMFEYITTETCFQPFLSACEPSGICGGFRVLKTLLRGGWNCDKLSTR